MNKEKRYGDRSRILTNIKLKSHYERRRSRDNIWRQGLKFFKIDEIHEPTESRYIYHGEVAEHQR